MPRLMVTELVVFAIRSCNMFPSSVGVSTTMSPLTIVTGAGPVDFNHLRLEFGTYVHVFNENTPTNTMAQRTTGAIALNSTGNSKGSYFFLNLETGRRVSRHQWTVLPMPSSVIQQVNYLGLKDKMPLLRDNTLLFERLPGIPLDDDSLDDEAIDHLAFGDEGDDDDFLPHADDTDVPLLDLDPVTADEFAVLAPSPLPAAPVPPLPVDKEERVDEILPPKPIPVPVPTERGAAPTESEREAASNDQEGGAASTDQEGGAASNDQERGAASTDPGRGAGLAYNLRSRSEASQRTTFNEQFDNPASSKIYAPHLQFFQSSINHMIEDPQELHSHLCDLYEVVHFCFNQMSAKEGIKKHGEAAVMALFSEFAQLHDKRVFKAIRASELTKAQKRNALYAINLIKEKRNGNLKGRTCADGRKQRAWNSKEETTSPTVSNDSLMALLAL